MCVCLCMYIKSLLYLTSNSGLKIKTQQEQQEPQVYNTTLILVLSRSTGKDKICCEPSVPRILLWRRKFPVSLMKPSFGEGKSLSCKVSYPVKLKFNKLIFSISYKQQNEKPIQINGLNIRHWDEYLNTWINMVTHGQISGYMQIKVFDLKILNRLSQYIFSSLGITSFSGH